ncbi:hypothetical protein C2845_PM04G16910 [Panicum miliaceum]|uniref:Uncharacterized protein n=1 Tax=Panicum miliaceum TaxID=4540 RepID=A0A3L6QTA5_PANMI|nr:hypothetical protein C2845_PM04G16910 [Panicum miliaceum]
MTRRTGQRQRGRQLDVRAVPPERRHAPRAAGTLNASASGGDPAAEAAAPAQHVDGGSTSLLGSAAAGTPGRAGVDAKKAISDAKLAELALVRLLGNVTLWVDRWNSFGIWIKLKLGNF